MAYEVGCQTLGYIYVNRTLFFVLLLRAASNLLLFLSYGGGHILGNITSVDVSQSVIFLMKHFFR